LFNGIIEVIRQHASGLTQRIHNSLGRLDSLGIVA
jgi:hypothetical protein